MKPLQKVINLFVWAPGFSYTLLSAFKYHQSFQVVPCLEESVHLVDCWWGRLTPVLLEEYVKISVFQKNTAVLFQ